MQPQVDELLEYRWSGNQLVGRCRMRAFHTPIGLVVLLDELADNHGPSVTNAAAEVIQAAAKVLGVSTEDTIFIEPYGDFSYNGGRGGDETFCRMRLEGPRKADCQHWPNQMAYELLGDGLNG